MDAPTTAHQLSRDDSPAPIRVKLSALWVSVMFLYVYVDIIGFYQPGTITGILEGRVWVLEISQGWALGALTLMAIPSLMVSISLMARATVARWANLGVASVLVPVSLGNAIGESWAYYWVGAILETVLLVLIIRSTWNWSRRAPATASPMPIG